MCVVFATQASMYLAKPLAKLLGASLGGVVRKVFGDGEEYYRIDIPTHDALHGKDIVYVAATSTDADLLELIRVGSTLSELGARRRAFFIPFLGYSTMERAVLPGEVATAKVNARLLSSIPNAGMGNAFFLVDLHVAGLLHYFEGSCTRTEVYAQDLLLEGIRDLNLTPGSFMFASADLGRPLWVQSFASHFSTDMAFIQKTRRFEDTRVLNVIGDVTGKHVIIYDDMTRSGSSLVHAADAYLNKGATKVTAVLSHLALNNEKAIDALLASRIGTIITTNTHPMSQNPKVQASDRFVVKDISPIMAVILRRNKFGMPPPQVGSDLIQRTDGGLWLFEQEDSHVSPRGGQTPSPHTYCATSTHVSL
eukprot:TRINITY_DN21711_c0_g1_i1.p1 TRINITY_DN21711_c0_g1~~TRINITY_DN21711_c0_g1_i1.p1  ORF type:complete len:365 (+),score=71.16 TRINITY_DN21711_c0_g1_i1:3-1097(+)